MIEDFKRELMSLYEQEELDQIILYSFEHCCSFTRADLILHSDKELSIEEKSQLRAVLHGLCSGRPVQYVLGYSWFMDHKLKVSPAVLIPRPETEELVRWIIQDHEAKASVNLKVLDICTGSGCIALSLAYRFPEWKLQATDISPEALKIALENNRIMNTDVGFLEADFLNWEVNDDHLTPDIGSQIKNKSLDLIVSNPPYVLEGERAEMNSRVYDNEPSLALFVPNDDPLIFYRKIAEFASSKLRQGGKIYLEINRAYAKDIVRLLKDCSFTGILVKKDILDNERMVSATFNS
jgi:release factor glutamine methyltransferase